MWEKKRARSIVERVPVERVRWMSSFFSCLDESATDPEPKETSKRASEQAEQRGGSGLAHGGGGGGLRWPEWQELATTDDVLALSICRAPISEKMTDTCHAAMLLPQKIMDQGRPALAAPRLARGPALSTQHLGGP